MNSDAVERDDGVRAPEGVVACLTDIGGGRSRLIFDDVIQGEEGSNRVWRDVRFYTWNSYDSHSIDNMSLSDAEYKQIGIALVARLRTINKLVKP